MAFANSGLDCRILFLLLAFDTVYLCDEEDIVGIYTRIQSLCGYIYLKENGIYEVKCVECWSCS